MTDQLVRTPLWDIQIEDLEHLKEQAQVLIGNEMGTGKTLFAVERDLRLRVIDKLLTKTLVIAPLNTFDGWLRTFRNETDLKVRVIDPKARHTFLAVEADIYLMHPEALALMPELRDFGFDHVIADECHYYKNRKAKRTKALFKLAVPYKTAMSGSPATDRPSDIWAILHWLKPRVYTSYWRFYKEMVDYEIIYPHGYHKVKGPSRLWMQVGLDEIRPFYVRHLKKDSMDIPDKLYEEVMVDLDVQQRRAYNEMRDEMIAWVGPNDDQILVAPAVIAKLQRLQMLAIGYLHYNEETGKFTMSEPSPKLDAAMDVFDRNPDETFVVFSQFKAPLYMLAKRLERVNIGYGTFTGDDKRTERDDAKAAFLAGDTRVFLSTIKSGGVGVDGLQWVCHNGIFLDRDWSPEINKQAEDRLHRGGQEKQVNIIDIMARNTVDRGRKTRIEEKAGWIRRLLGDEV